MIYRITLTYQLSVLIHSCLCSLTLRQPCYNIAISCTCRTKTKTKKQKKSQNEDEATASSCFTLPTALIYSRNSSDLQLVSSLARVRNSRSLFQSDISTIFFCRGFSCCPYFHAPGKSCFPGPTRRELLGKCPSEPKQEIRYRKTMASHEAVKGLH